jgi:hypothetical protein
MTYPVLKTSILVSNCFLSGFVSFFLSEAKKFCFACRCVYVPKYFLCCKDFACACVFGSNIQRLLLLSL